LTYPTGLASGVFLAVSRADPVATPESPACAEGRLAPRGRVHCNGFGQSTDVLGRRDPTTGRGQARVSGEGDLRRRWPRRHARQAGETSHPGGRSPSGRAGRHPALPGRKRYRGVCRPLDERPKVRRLASALGRQTRATCAYSAPYPLKPVSLPSAGDGPTMPEVLVVRARRVLRVPPPREESDTRAVATFLERKTTRLHVHA